MKIWVSDNEKEILKIILDKISSKETTKEDKLSTALYELDNLIDFAINYDSVNFTKSRLSDMKQVTETTKLNIKELLEQ
jgi:hypothetical protein